MIRRREKTHIQVRHTDSLYIAIESYIDVFFPRIIKMNCLFHLCHIMWKMAEIRINIFIISED